MINLRANLFKTEALLRFVVKSAQMCKVSSDLKTGAALKAVQRCTSRLLRKRVASTVFNVIIGSVMEPFDGISSVL